MSHLPDFLVSKYLDLFISWYSLPLYLSQPFPWLHPHLDNNLVLLLFLYIKLKYFNIWLKPYLLPPLLLIYITSDYLISKWPLVFSSIYFLPMFTPFLNLIICHFILQATMFCQLNFLHSSVFQLACMIDYCIIHLLSHQTQAHELCLITVKIFVIPQVVTLNWRDVNGSHYASKASSLTQRQQWEWEHISFLPISSKWISSTVDCTWALLLNPRRSLGGLIYLNFYW